VESGHQSGMLLCVIANYSDIQFQSAVHSTSAADSVVIQHHLSYECHNASFHLRYLPTHKHVRIQDSALRLSWPIEGEWSKQYVHRKVT